MTALNYRTPGVWGAGLGTNLTAAQVDQNFYDLNLAIIAAADAAGVPVSIANITVVGTQLTVVLTDATELGPFTLPTATLEWAGVWLPDTPYGEFNIVRVGFNVYLVLAAHTSDSVFDPEAIEASEPLYQLIFEFDSGNLKDVDEVATDSYVPVLGDAGMLKRCTNVAGCTIVLPYETSVPFANGTVLRFSAEHPEGITEGTFVEVTGDDTGTDPVVVNCPPSYLPHTEEQFAIIEAIKVGIDEWTVSGRLEHNHT